MTRTTPRPTSDWLPPVAADLVCVFLFAIGGKSSHEASSSEWLVLAIVWPFVVAVMLAHVGLVVRGRAARRVWPEGVVVLAVTYVVGMALRVVSGRGIEVGFLVVAALFLALTMLGWRAAPRLVSRGLSDRRNPDVSSDSGDAERR